MTHTPGPWKPVRSLTCGHLRAAHNYQSDPQQEWTNHDINLISVAPELLTKLNELLEWTIGDETDYQASQNAEYMEFRKSVEDLIKKASKG